MALSILTGSMLLSEHCAIAPMATGYKQVHHTDRFRLAFFSAV